MKKLFSFMFMMLSVLILASCNGGDNPSNTNGKINTASVKEAATELANEIDKVGSPLDVIGYDMSNIKTELKSYTMMSYNSDGSEGTTDDDGWEDYQVPEWKKSWNDNGGSNEFSGKMANLIQDAYELSIGAKNRILKANNQYMYVWNEQTNGSKTRITFNGDILSLEEYGYKLYGVNHYTKVYVERDLDNKLFFEILMIGEDGNYNYCNYYEDRNYDVARKFSDEFYSKPYLFSIDLTNDYPVMIMGRSYNGNTYDVHIELETKYIEISKEIEADSNFSSYGFIDDHAYGNNHIIINNDFVMGLTDDYLIVPANDKVVNSIKVKKEGRIYFGTKWTFKNGEEAYNDYTQMFDYEINDANGYVKPTVMYIKYNSINEIDGLLKKYGYIDSSITLDFSVLTPHLLDKDFKDLTIDYVISKLNDRIPEIKKYSSYNVDLEDADKLKCPFEMQVSYDLKGTPILSESSIDLSNIELKITNVTVKDSNYKFNMKDIIKYKIYYKGKKIKEVNAIEENGVSIMENIGTINLDKTLIDSEEANIVTIEVYGIGVCINIIFNN